MRNGIAVLLVAIFIAPQGLAGNVFKCKDTEGRTYFSDRTCPSDQAQTELTVESAPAAGVGKSHTSDRTLHNRPRAVDRRLKSEQRKRDAVAAKRKAARKAQRKKDKRLLARLKYRDCATARCRGYAYTPTDSKGNKRVATEHEKQAKIKSVDANIAKSC
ncbi:MAG: DUF4124 domain-containing protein [Chromatiales bacterium]|nr:DUF4124 domain-containing protein [Chromatiales bacterium]